MRAAPEIVLTPREIDVLQLVCMAQPDKEIARHLEISGWTVRSHLRTLFGKFRVSSRAGLVQRVLETRLIPIRSAHSSR